MSTANQKATMTDAALMAASDPEVMARAKNLMMRLFGEVDYIIATGSSAEIAKLASSVIPAILRETTRAEQSEADRRMAEEYSALRGQIAASLVKSH